MWASETLDLQFMPEKRRTAREFLKSAFEGERGSFLRFMLFSLLVALLLMSFLPGTNFFTWIRAGIDIRRQERQIEYYNRRIEEMDREIKTLKSDRDSLERFAREQFQYAAPGDDVYIIVQ